jgi:hypothetical protein
MSFASRAIRLLTFTFIAIQFKVNACYSVVLFILWICQKRERCFEAAYQKIAIYFCNQPKYRNSPSVSIMYLWSIWDIGKKTVPFSDEEYGWYVGEHIPFVHFFLCCLIGRWLILLPS